MVTTTLALRTYILVTPILRSAALRPVHMSIAPRALSPKIPPTCRGPLAQLAGSHLESSVDRVCTLASVPAANAGFIDRSSIHVEVEFIGSKHHAMCSCRPHCGVSNGCDILQQVRKSMRQPNFFSCQNDVSESSELSSELSSGPSSEVDAHILEPKSILCTSAFGAFSALRAYALSNRNIWLAALIILLAPPTVLRIIQGINVEFQNLPSPFNCSIWSSLSPALSVRFTVIGRASQLAAELLVIGITWWYSYRSYRITKNNIKLGRSLSSLLIYNGSIYFLFLGTLYLFDIIVNTASVSVKVLNVDNGQLAAFYNPITSILTCRFMLSLRQLDSSTASGTYSRPGSRVRDHAASTVLRFAAQPSDSLPSFIASFAHPVHVDSSLSETDPDEIVDDGSEWREMEELKAPTRTTRTPSCQSPAADQPSDLEHFV
ncbi:hypothetical protein LXA43DRAFT_210190 [Ganoderma leucocontextum]|nr:hypothetical protein LXA43DRAFT_210190 [Ganoderma leucocontextum]